MQVEPSCWDQFIALHPDSHILQDSLWGDLKSGFGWKTEQLVSGDCGAQVLFRRLPLGYSIGYVPKGPIGHSSDLLFKLDQVCKKQKAIFVKIEPFAWEPDESWQKLEEMDWVKSAPIQPRRTVTLPLTATEEDILAGMKQKTRYNIRLAEKKGIEIHPSEDYRSFHAMAQVTGQRDGFGVHALSYYLKVQQLFEAEKKAVLLMAYFEGKPIAGIIVFARGKNAWYMYGASTDEERNRMPTYLLQWEAIKWAKAHGCEEYDLWGIPDHDEDELESLFTEKHQHDGLWGVYRFKRGFGGTIRRSVGAWDRVYNPVLYSLYQFYVRVKKRGLD